MPFYKIVVPTVDTVRYEFIVNSLLKNQFPVLIVGPVGTGKTSILQSVLNFLDEEKYSVLTLNMSAQTTSKNVQVNPRFPTKDSLVKECKRCICIGTSWRSFARFRTQLRADSRNAPYVCTFLQAVKLWSPLWTTLTCLWKRYTVHSRHWN